jgi:hypothetical protein
MNQRMTVFDFPFNGDNRYNFTAGRAKLNIVCNITYFFLSINKIYTIILFLDIIRRLYLKQRFGDWILCLSSGKNLLS